VHHVANFAARRTHAIVALVTSSVLLMVAASRALAELIAVQLEWVNKVRRGGSDRARHCALRSATEATDSNFFLARLARASVAYLLTNTCFAIKFSVALFHTRWTIAVAATTIAAPHTTAMTTTGTHIFAAPIAAKIGAALHLLRRTAALALHTFTFHTFSTRLSAFAVAAVFSAR